MNVYLHQAKFNEADLRGADFDGADLTDVDFKGAKIQDVNFKESKGYQEVCEKEQKMKKLREFHTSS